MVLKAKQALNASMGKVKRRRYMHWALTARKDRYCLLYADCAAFASAYIKLAFTDLQQRSPAKYPKPLPEYEGEVNRQVLVSDGNYGQSELFSRNSESSGIQSALPIGYVLQAAHRPSVLYIALVLSISALFLGLGA
jgi:hypothetical protein